MLDGREINVVGFVNETWFDSVLKQARRVHHPAGQTVHFAGDAFLNLGLIISGQIEIWHIGVDGKEIWLGTCKTGDVIGSSAMFPGKLTDFNWVALSNVTLLSLSPTSFSVLSKEHSELATTMFERASYLLDETRKAFVLSQTQSARGRIKHELLRLSEEVGIDPDVRIIRPSPIFADMARRANTTRETVSRTVSDLCKSGALDRQPGALVLRNPNNFV